MVNELIRLDYDGGLSYMFTNLITAENLYPYTTRLHMLKRALSESPLYTWIVGKCASWYEKLTLTSRNASMTIKYMEWTISNTAVFCILIIDVTGNVEHDYVLQVFGSLRP